MTIRRLRPATQIQFAMEYIDSTVQRIPARSRRQAMDWSLVLMSQGIECTIDRTEDVGWGLIVTTADHERALESLEKYRTENRPWPWRQEIPSGILFDWGSVGWAFLLCLFFWISQRWPAFRDAGILDGSSVSHGEWWRLSTAIFLHADPGHLAANAGIGLILLGLVMGRYGTGIGLLAAYLAGVGGSLATWLIHRSHDSLGASGMVMGCVGLLGAQAIGPSRHPQALKFALRGAVGAVMLFVLFGLNPETDVAAHGGGFVAGFVIGIALAGKGRTQRSALANVFAGAAFCLSVILSWWFAIARFH